MNAQIIGAIASGAIPALGGLLATLFGNRVLGKKPGQDPKYDLWHERHGKALRILGPLIALFGLGTMAVGIARALPEPEEWKRVRTPDGGASVEFPYSPKADTKTEDGMRIQSLGVNFAPSEDAKFLVRVWNLQPELDEVLNDAWFDAMRDATPSSVASKGHTCKMVDEKTISLSGFPGREYEFTVGDSHYMQVNLFLKNGWAYMIVAVTPLSSKDDAKTRRFLKSFRFENLAK